mgnify:CR=1 FL=1
MELHRWVEEFPGSITVCDPAGIILEMNARAAETFAKDGGKALVGTSLLDCHPEPSRSQLLIMMETHQTHVYIITEKGVRQLIYECPWYLDGAYAGFMELILPLPDDFNLVKPS